MWVFLERAGDGLYIGEAYDDDGSVILERTEPMSARALEKLIVPLDPYGDTYDFDVALYDADERPGESVERWRAMFLLKVRASAGQATWEDGQWVVEELSNPDSIFPTIRLLYTLGMLGRAYESAALPFLRHPNTNGEAESAMSALIAMGLVDEYADRLVDWMQGGAPGQPYGGGSVYGEAAHAFRRSGNRKILRALVQAAKDRTEQWTPREHAMTCLAQAIDLENAPLGQRMSPDDPYMQGVLAKAEKMLAAAEARDDGTV
jgi:hypothetical protein